jgi:glycosyltransferase involved in cell wall biosynthesis
MDLVNVADECLKKNSNESKFKKVGILLLHNRQNSGLYDYAMLFNEGYSSSSLILLSDNYRGISQWRFFLFFFKYKRQIIEQIEGLKRFDVIHICDNPIYSHLILGLLEKNNIKFIYTLHDPDFHLETDFIGRLKNGISHLFLNKVFNLLNKSHCGKIHIHRNWDIKKLLKPAIVLPHPRYVNNQDLVMNFNGTLKIGFFGRLEYYKGIDIFMSILERLDLLVLKGSLEVIIAGEGRLNKLPALQNIVLEIHNYFVEREKFDNLVSGVHLILLPYRQASQSGILMKALSFNIPVMVSDLVELTSLVIPNQTGICLSLDDDEKWIEYIMGFMADRKLLKEMSLNLKKMKDFNDPVFLANELYNSIA